NKMAWSSFASPAIHGRTSAAVIHRQNKFTQSFARRGSRFLPDVGHSQSVILEGTD
ncbi:hypothetical protein J6590_065268, partial [Homalodisca vitripennis]